MMDGAEKEEEEEKEEKEEKKGRRNWRKEERKETAAPETNGPPKGHTFRDGASTTWRHAEAASIGAFDCGA